MKAYRITIFIFSIIAGLALLCSFFPEEGVRLGSAQLRFPSIEDIMAVEPAEELLSPEEIVRQRMEAITQARRSHFEDYCKNDPARFYCPNDDVSVLDPLFEAFEAASDKPVRIVHYGDSQIEVDRVTSSIRNFLQTKFGGMGSGMQPVRQEYYTRSVVVQATAEPQRYMAFGPEEMRGDSKQYGPLAQSSRLDTTLTVTFFPLKGNEGLSRFFNHATVLCANVEGTLYLSCGKQKQEIQSSGKPIERIRFNLPDSTTQVSITMSGNADVFGIQLDGDKGISMDNVPMRGCSGTIFTRIDSHQLSDYFTNDNVRLLLLQYGGNVVPYANTDKSISDYKSAIQRQIKYLEKLAPKATVIFIGPSDMSKNIDGKMQTYEKLPALVDSLKAAANNCGAVFWDMYGAMGGHNSMARWVNAQPALAGSDYVHFTPKGASMMGDMFSESLMLYYKYYRFRKYGNEEGTEAMEGLE